MALKKRVTSTATIDEPLIFEKSREGRKGFSLPNLDVPHENIDHLIDKKFLRDEIDGFPEVSEFDVITHFTRLSTYNYCIELGLYPLGSCTMKYNPKINEAVARLDGISRSHPYQPESLSQGNLQIIKMLEDVLAEITGMDAVTLQPAAGAQGELAGILMVRAYHQHQGNPRKIILIPDSAHGTNPASATTGGYVTKTLRSNTKGCISTEELNKLMTEEVACLMLTNPNTLGIFEENILDITDIVHRKGGLVYMDGANMNALVGISRPGDFGVDLLQLNLHKTFSTPHGGGGPGGGPVAVKKILQAFLPTPIIEALGKGQFKLTYDRPQSIGRLRAFYGNFGVLVRALSYILTFGSDGLRQISEHAVLNANYIRYHLEPSYHLPFKQPTLHEVVFSDKLQAKKQVYTIDIAKRLMDYGFHPPTIYFPLIVAGALMIEPTESAGKEELDDFIDALKQIAKEAEEDPGLLKAAPHTTRNGRFDEATAARKPILRWNKG